VPFVRTVEGDIDAAQLGTTYSHEHLVIDGGRPVELFPDFRLDDIELMSAELAPAVELGLRSVVDAMPADAGRNVRKLVEIGRRAGVQVVASTGLHHARYYGPSHWSERASETELADLFVADVSEGIDERDYSGPIVHRTTHRAGVIKIAGSEGGLSTRDRRVFAAAADAHRRAGVPILTHCENGTGGPEQVGFLIDCGVEPGHLALSHVDKLVDRGLHRELLSAGVTLEYDQGFRWRDQPNGTLQLLQWMFEDGFGDRIVLGMDAARQGYLRAYGGSPGLTFLLGEFSVLMAGRGIDEAARHRLFVDNPARVYAFALTGGAAAPVAE
jgi:predicted metal-dependent phosphotriesterase family hydrolase